MVNINDFTNDIQPFDLSSLQTVKDLLEKKLSMVNTAIEFLSGERVGGIAWVSRAVNCVRGYDRPVLQREILECLFVEQEEKLNDKRRRKNYSIALSGALTHLVEKKLLVRHKELGRRGFYYLLPEWVDSKGNIKTKYKKILDDQLMIEYAF